MLLTFYIRYDPLNKFMLLKHFECSIAQPPRVFEMIITPDLEYPIGRKTSHTYARSPLTLLIQFVSTCDGVTTVDH